MSIRYRTEGSIYYVTSVIYNRLNVFIAPSFVIPIIDSLNYYRFQYACMIIGYVVMPDHIHLLIYPQHQPALTEFMRDFKQFTSGRITRQAKVEGKREWLESFKQAGVDTERAEHKLWQDSFWEQCIHSEGFLKQKLDYIHNNPVRSGIVKTAIEYPYSSLRNYQSNDNQLIEIDTEWD